VAAWRACQRSGVQRRVGMSGVLVGLDLAEAASAARLYGAEDEERLLYCLEAVERGAVKGAADAARKPGEG
jgi:hypothetical protein